MGGVPTRVVNIRRGSSNDTLGSPVRPARETEGLVPMSNRRRIKRRKEREPVKPTTATHQSGAGERPESAEPTKAGRTFSNPWSRWRRRRERLAAARRAERAKLLESSFEALEQGDIDAFTGIMKTLHPGYVRTPQISRERAERLYERDRRGAERLRRREQKAKEREYRAQERQKKRLGLSPEEGGMDRYWNSD